MTGNVDEKLNALVERVGKVRRWLVALAVLRVAALSLVFVSAYIALYALLDHRLNFDQVARTVALLVLIAGVAGLLFLLTRSLLGHVSYSRAASHIENRKGFQQQLVAAVEYYEKRDDYPYSKALAEQLVARVTRDSETFNFDSTVHKWQGYVLAAVILLGLSAVGFYVHDNYVYFRSYFSRLARPLAAVEPLSSASLRSITGDIVAEPNSVVTFAAEIRGPAPESGRLVVTPIEPNSPEDGPQPPRLEALVRPVLQANGPPRLETSESFSQMGRSKYRFEAGTISSEWHTLTIRPAPAIKHLTARVTVPRRPPRRKWIEPYTEQIENNTLNVIASSSVTLAVQATENLKEAVITGPDGRSVTRSLNGADKFSFSFTADKTGTVKFQLVGEHGLNNDNPPELEVTVKQDEPPKLRLISPAGDYLATNVASVPIEFEITDDFGLDSAHVYFERPGGKPAEVQVPISEGAKKAEFAHVLELDAYDLNVGDSILFYARATDVDTGSALPQRTAGSDVYFIEIRPYRQTWRPGQEGGSGSGGGGTPVPDLLNILEYTRAVLKKTFAIAEKTQLTDQDRSRLKAIADDVRYCADQLTTIRDDPEIAFNNAQKAVLSEVLQYYARAAALLDKHDAAPAVAPEKDAYRVLRKFIIELELEYKPPDKSQGQQPTMPDSVKLQESPEFEQYEKERIDEEIKKLQRKLRKLTDEQKQLKTSFVNFLEQRRRTKQPGKRDEDTGRDGQSAAKQTPGSQTPSPGASKAAGDSAGKSAGDGQTQADSQTASGQGSPGKDRGSPTATSPDSGRKDDGTIDAAPDKDATDKESPGDTREQNAGRKDTESQQGAKPGDTSKTTAPGDTGTPEAGQGSEGQGPRQGRTASEGSEGREGQGRGTGGDSQGADRAPGSPADRRGPGQTESHSRPNAAGADARLSMLQSRQTALQQQVSQLKRDLQQLSQMSKQAGSRTSEQVRRHLENAVEKMNDLQKSLAEARYEPQMSRRTLAEAIDLMDLAKRELEMADEGLDGMFTLDEAEKTAKKAQQIAEQLAEDAEALDESLTPVQREQMLARLEAAERLLESMARPQWTTVGSSPGGQANAHVFTTDKNATPAEAARELARRFWSIALSARKHRGQIIEDEPSDVRFHTLEKEFFENAARFDGQAKQK
ncbi:MAG: hypothetical protein JSU94_13295 [Phycisphaerales bacterium]|nr:MAG: hypothetical protein JSU94_13295 [Phycisphaerales bacterium]